MRESFPIETSLLEQEFPIAFLFPVASPELLSPQSKPTAAASAQQGEHQSRSPDCGKLNSSSWRGFSAGCLRLVLSCTVQSCHFLPACPLFRCRRRCCCCGPSFDIIPDDGEGSRSPHHTPACQDPTDWDSKGEKAPGPEEEKQQGGRRRAGTAVAVGSYDERRVETPA